MVIAGRCFEMILLICLSICSASCSFSPSESSPSPVLPSHVTSPGDSQPTSSVTSPVVAGQPVPAGERRPRPTVGVCGRSGADFNGDGFADLAVAKDEEIGTDAR